MPSRTFLSWNWKRRENQCWEEDAKSHVSRKLEKNQVGSFIEPWIATGKVDRYNESKFQASYCFGRNGKNRKRPSRESNPGPQQTRLYPWAGDVACLGGSRVQPRLLGSRTGSIPGWGVCDFFSVSAKATSNFPFPLSLPLSFPSSSFPFLFLSLPLPFPSSSFPFLFLPLRPFVCALNALFTFTFNSL